VEMEWFEDDDDQLGATKLKLRPIAAGRPTPPPSAHEEGLLRLLAALRRAELLEARREARRRDRGPHRCPECGALMRPVG
jgi:hypothetical protein